MNNSVLINDAPTVISKNFTTHIMSSLDENHRKKIHVNQWAGHLFNTYQKQKRKLLIWTTSAYNQELHNFIIEYSNECKIILIEDIEIQQNELVEFINNNQQIYLISKKKIWKNIIAQYDYIYDHNLFYNKNLSRNNKYIVLLSSDNNINHSRLDPIVYPAMNLPIVAVGNPDFDSIINLGSCKYTDLPDIFNEFSYVIDLNHTYTLEATACNIPIIDTTIDLKQAIDENKYIELDKTLIMNNTYQKFVENHIINFIKDNII